MVFNNPHVVSIADFENHPVWIERDLGKYTPLEDLPANDLESCFVACNLLLANNDEIRGVLSGIYLNNPELTRITIGLIIIKNGQMFGYRKDLLEPYKSEMVSEFLSLSMSSIFPIRYDLSELAIGHPEVIRGTIDASYPEEMDRAARIKFIMEQHDRPESQ